MSLLRTRWAAIGAAVAVTLGAGGIGMVAATSPSEAVTFVPITPCRLFDTRPEFQVGTRSAPLGPGDIHTVDATGSNGDCTGIPSNATAVSMNMTSTDATDPTFLTVWAAGETRPDASSMNPVPGAPAVPNGVISALNGDGEFSVFNLAGSVHVLADINGYYVDHHHDDRYYTQTEVNGLLASQPVTEHVSVPAAAFQARFSVADVTPGPGADLTQRTFENSTGGDSSLIAPLLLPDGAVIESVSFAFVDDDVDEDITLWLWRASLESHEQTQIANISSTGATPLVRTTVGSSVDDTPVDNSQETLFVEVGNNGWASRPDADLLRFAGLSVEYTIVR